MPSFLYRRTGYERATVGNRGDNTFMCEPGEHFANAGAVDLKYAGKLLLHKLGTRDEPVFHHRIQDALINGVAFLGCSKNLASSAGFARTCCG